MHVTSMQQAIRQRVFAALDATASAPIAPALGPRDLTRLMRRDHNGDGQLGVDEFKPTQARKHSQLDLNQDGSVTMAELVEFARRVAGQASAPRPIVPERPGAIRPVPMPVAPERPGAIRPVPMPIAPERPGAIRPVPMPVAPERPRTMPIAPADPLTPKAPASGQAPYINQYHPAGAEQGYTNGPANCGPTSMAMIARAVGYGSDLSDAALINHLGAIGGTSAAGTPVANLAPMAEAMGLTAEVKGPGADVGWIATQLQAGKMVVANGDPYELGPGRDPNQSGGHYVLVTGMTPEGNFRVHDPAKPSVSTVTPAELERFIASNPNGGYQIAVG